MKPQKIKTYTTALDWFLEILALTLVLATASLILYHYKELPERISIFFNWPSKDEEGMAAKSVIWASPIIDFILVVAMAIIIRIPKIWTLSYEIHTFEEKQKNYRFGSRILRFYMPIIALMGFCLSLMSVQAAFDRRNPILFDYFFPVNLILLFAPVVYILVVNFMRWKKGEKPESI